jgi:hypothetical protein
VKVRLAGCAVGGLCMCGWRAVRLAGYECAVGGLCGWRAVNVRLDCEHAVVCAVANPVIWRL